MVGSVSPRVSARLVMFTYYNPIMRRGAELFCQQAKAAGASGRQLPCVGLNPKLRPNPVMCRTAWSSSASRPRQPALLVGSCHVWC